MVSFSYSLRPDGSVSYLSQVAEITDFSNIEVQVNSDVSAIHIADIEDGIGAKFKCYDPANSSILLFQK